MSVALSTALCAPAFAGGYVGANGEDRGDPWGGDAYAPCVPADPAAPAAKASTSAMPPTGDSVAIAGAGAGVVAAAVGVAFAAYRRFKGNM